MLSSTALGMKFAVCMHVVVTFCCKLSSGAENIHQIAWTSGPEPCELDRNFFVAWTVPANTFSQIQTRIQRPHCSKCFRLLPQGKRKAGKAEDEPSAKRREKEDVEADDPVDPRSATKATVGFGVDTTLNVVPAMQGKVARHQKSRAHRAPLDHQGSIKINKV